MDAALGLGGRESWKDDRRGVDGVGTEVVLGAGGRTIFKEGSADGGSFWSRSEKEEGTMAAPDNGRGNSISCCWRAAACATIISLTGSVRVLVRRMVAWSS